MKIGYMRVPGQGVPQEAIAMESLGVEKVFIDRVDEGVKDRPELEKLLAFVREGDTVVVENLDSFAKNARDFLGLIKKITDKNVAFVSKEEAIDTTTEAGQHMLVVFDAIARIGRNRALQRQAEGIAVAKAEGKYTGRKPIEMSEAVMAEQYRLWKNGETSPTLAAKKLGISRATFYYKVEEYEKAHGIDPIAEAQKAFVEQYRLWKSGETAPRFAAKKLGISHATFYRRVAEYEQKHGIAPSVDTADVDTD